MSHSLPIDISNFFVVGINYRNADSDLRGQFAIDEEQYQNMLNNAVADGLDSLFVLSTCNRTEVYGFANSAMELIRLLCDQTKGDSTTFTALAYIKNGNDAVNHLFHVGAGLDSQILGDYEIVAQLKQAIKFARERKFINCFLDRLTSAVLRASKVIKSHTAISGGSVSVSFAAVQFIKNSFQAPQYKKILLLGAGKIGRNTCQNLLTITPGANITLINRTPEKARALAQSLKLNYADLNDLALHIRNADIIVLATNAAEPVLFKHHLTGSNSKLIIDLAIPYNASADLKQLPHIKLVNVDDLSKIKDETLEKRKAELPKAMAIVLEHAATFMDWYQTRKKAAALTALKNQLHQIALAHPQLLSDRPFVDAPADWRIQQVVNTVAAKMSTHRPSGCQYINAINDFIGHPYKLTAEPLSGAVTFFCQKQSRWPADVFYVIEIPVNFHVTTAFEK